MAGNIKGITIEIGGEANGFKKALKEMNSATQATQKELNAVNRALQFDPKNVDLLKQKEQLLAKQIEDTKIKVEKLKAAKEKADKEMADGTEVNQEQYRQLGREISAAEGQLKSLEKQTDKFSKSAKEVGDKLSDIGKKGLKVTGAITGIGVAVATMGLKAAQSADDINTLAKQTGLSTEQIQKFQYASERIDVPLETLTGSMAKLTRNMQSAKNGSKNTQLAFKELGISITDNEGKLRNNQDVFNEAIDALAKMENETQRDAVAMQIFGKSAQDLNPLILGGSEALKQYGEEAEKAGLILSQDTLDAANELGDAVDKLKATTTGAFAKVGSEIATKLTPLIEPAADKLVKVVDVISDMDAAQLKLIAGIGIGLATVPPLIIGAGKVVTAIGTISAAYKKMTTWANAAENASKMATLKGLGVAGAIGIIGVKINDAFMTAHKNNSQYAKLLDNTNKMNEALTQQATNYEKLKQAAQENLDASMGEINFVENLKEELEGLADESGRVEETDRARASVILNHLNEALGTEYTMTGNMIDNYRGLKKSVEELIETKKIEALLSAKEAPFKQAVAQIEGAKKTMDVAKEAYEKAADNYNKVWDKHGNITEAGKKMSAQDLADITKTYEQTKKTYDSASKVYENYLTDIEEYTQLEEDITQDGAQAVLDAWAERNGMMTSVQREAATNYNQSLIDLANYEENYRKGVKGYTKAGLEEAQANVIAMKTECEKIGVAINEGVAKGVGNQDAVKDAVDKLCKNIPSWAKKMLGINSPAKVAIPLGEAIPQGIGVGIEKDMSAEEALEKKCNNLKKILSDYTDEFEADIKLAKSEYELWESANPNANDDVKRDMERVMLVKTATGQNSTVQAINDALWFLGETAGTDSTEYKLMLADLNEATAKLNETNAKIAKLDRYLPQQYSESNVDLAESQYILWKARNPEATEYENLIQQEKKLNVEYEEQGKKVQDLNDELYQQIQLNGENSEESKKLLIQLNKEKAAYEELAREIANVNEKKAQYSGGGGGGGTHYPSGSSTPMAQYAAYHVQYGAMLKSQGVSQEAIDAAARKVSGYSGERSINITNNNYGVTSDTAYKVSKETAKTANNLAMQGVL